MQTPLRCARSPIAAALLTCALATPAHAFSQNALNGIGSPPGHDYLTGMAGLEALQVTKPNPSRQLSAKDLTVPPGLVAALRKQARQDARFAWAPYDSIISAIYGNRWVDLAGTMASDDCFDGIAQQPDELQHDHFLRGLYEAGFEGGKKAVEDSVGRFKRYFVKAATAPEGRMYFQDGGMITSDPMLADRRFFLLGRALHLIQDSFSTEHAIRSTSKPEVVIGIKTYVCTLHSQMHTKNLPLTPFVAAGSDDGDVIWKSLVGWDRKKKGSETNVRPEALAAIEASKDVFAAFLRAIDQPPANRAAAAEAEARKLAENWFVIDERAMQFRLNSMSMNTDYIHDSREQLKCQDGEADFMDQVVQMQRRCAYNMWPGGGRVNAGTFVLRDKVEIDEVMGVPYVWTMNPMGRDEPPASYVFRGKGVPKSVLASAALERLVIDSKLFEEPKPAAKAQPLKKGAQVKVHRGRKNLKKDKTYEWCEAQVGTGSHRWVPCKALPAKYQKEIPARHKASRAGAPKK